jgi:hypothetical protein
MERAAADHSWEQRAATLLFRGAATGPTRKELQSSMHHWPALNSWHIDVGISSGIHSPQEFTSLYQHCAYK